MENNAGMTIQEAAIILRLNMFNRPKKQIETEYNFQANGEPKFYDCVSYGSLDVIINFNAFTKLAIRVKELEENATLSEKFRAEQGVGKRFNKHVRLQRHNISQLHNQGMSLHEIGRRLNIPYSTIRRHVKELTEAGAKISPPEAPK